MKSNKRSNLVNGLVAVLCIAAVLVALLAVDAFQLGAAAIEPTPAPEAEIAAATTTPAPAEEDLPAALTAMPIIYHIEEGDSYGEKDPAPTPEPTPEPTEAPAPTPEPTAAPEINPIRAELEAIFTEHIRDMLAQLLEGEAGNLKIPTAKRSMVVWTPLDRWDSGETAFGYDGIFDLEHIITKPMAFTGYSASNPIRDYNRALVDDVIDRYIREKCGETDVGRTLPADICYFVGDGNATNTFYKYSDSWVSGDIVWYGTEPLCDPYN